MAAVAVAGGVLGAAAAMAADAAVVLMYHRFGESDYPSTNISLRQFEEHIAELTSGPYTVMPVPDIVAAIRDGKPLPDRAIGITIDDAYRSIFTEAWPRLRAAGLPFTIFAATDPIDRQVETHMTWDQLRDLGRQGVTIGGHTVSHLHMVEAGTERGAKEIADANARFAAELGHAPSIFAYPYGEASLATEKLAKDGGYVAAFGQHSGVVHETSGMLFLPRFALNENFGGLARFKLVVNALPLPVSDVTPADSIFAADRPPILGFTVAGDVADLDRLTCFISDEGRVDVERLGDTRIEVRPRKLLPVGRSRMNCTMPTSGGRWRWWGRLLYVPKK
jgi:peptidoglycan/xylan/chitin deacetylase (PgdA/CDA1 family)